MDNEQVVCGCKHITYQDIKVAIHNGAKSFEEVQAKTNISTGCGQCEAKIRNIVHELLA